VFQDYALYPHMSVRGNLEFPLRMRGLARAEQERRVAWAAELLDIGTLLERMPRQLSGGQRQRVAMGRALVREPSVFLLDEPLSNLDARLRVMVRAEIGELQRRMGTTMLYVTHDQVEAMTLGQRVAVLDRGRLEQVGPPRELYERPASAFVAGFLGSPPMGLFATRALRDGDGALAVAIGRQRLVLPADHPAAPALAARLGETLTAGLRPEALAPAPVGDRPTLAARVDYAESLGHETLAHVPVPGDAGGDDVPLVARLPGLAALTPGAEIRLAVDVARLHLFDGQGRALA
jgi:multiple sugar transport system ATP-binding protein